MIRLFSDEQRNNFRSGKPIGTSSNGKIRLFSDEQRTAFKKVSKYDSLIEQSWKIEEQAQEEIKKATSFGSILKGTIGLGEPGLGAIGRIGKAIGGYGKAIVKEPKEAAKGVFETGVLKPISFVQKVLQPSVEQKPISEILGEPENEEAQKARNVGEFLGWLLPYSAVSKATGIAIRGITKSPKIAKLIPAISDTVGFLGTGQILYDDGEGTSRLKQLRNDAILLGVFKSAGLAYRGFKPGGAIKKEIETLLKDTKALFEKPKKISVKNLDKVETNVVKINNLIKQDTGSTAKELLQKEIIEKPKIRIFSDAERASFEKIKAEPLAQEARKYKSAEEFSKAWDIDGMRGRYWHITDSPNFKISKDISPKDATSIGMGQKGGEGLIVSSVPSQWLPYARNRKYISEIDLSKAKPNVDYTIVNRGFGQEVFIKNLDAVSVKSTKPIKQGMADVRNWEKAGFKNKEEAIDFYTQATKGAGTKERGFIVGARKIVPKAETRIAGQYIPRATDSLAIKARNLVIDDIRLAEKIALTRSDDVAVATASELLKKYADDAAKAVDQSISSALYDKAADVANTLAPKLTEQGRSIQAASILGRLTPEGQVRFAAREIQKFNELNPLKAIPELSGQQSKFILDEMKIINAMPEGVEKAMRFQKLQKGIQDLVPTPLFKKVIAVWKAGLLTGIKTQGLNLFSNISHGITEVVKDIPAAIVDNVAALFTGKRAKTLTIREAFSGLKDGLIKGKRYFVTGFDERNIAAKLDYKRVNFGKGIVAKSFQVYTDTVFRFLGAADQPFYYAAMSRSLMDQALALGKTKGLKGKKLVNFAHKVVEAPTEEMIRYGVADATTAVFQNQTKLGEAAAAIQKIPGIGEIILPFGRTPSSVAMQIINYSPVGIAKTIISNIGKGRFDQRLFSQGIGRGLTGTAIIAIGMEMSKKGMIALDYPQGDERLQELQKAEGVKNNAIKINGKWRSPIVLGPAGNLLLIGGHFQKAIEEEGSPTEALTKGMAGSMSSFLEQTFLTGVKSSVNAITDPERYAKTYLPNLVASFVPTIVSDVARATTGEEKRTEGVLQRIQSRIPGLRRKLEPQVDILGRERERIGNPLEVLADPSRPSPERGTLVTNELVRLRDEGFKVSPTALGNRQGYEGLTQEENTFLWKYTGQILDDKLTTLFNNETYKNASDNEKADAVENYVNNGKLIARVGMVIKLTQDLEGEELAKKLSELKEGGLLIKSVYDKWLELR